MTRAPALSPAERRRAIIAATVPLLLEHGTAVTTKQVAEAAGIAEGTIFRVFTSKDDLFHAAAQDALTSDGLEDALADVPDHSLEAAVVAIADAVGAGVRRSRTLVAMLHGRPHVPPAEGTCPRPDPRVLHDRVVGAVARVLATHADELRCSPERAASALVAWTFGTLHPIAGDPDLVDASALTDLFLHGIAKDTPCS